MKRGTIDHPKVKRFARQIRMASFSAVGLLEVLWHWTAEKCPEGDIGRFDDADIADAVDWPSERSFSEFTEALIAAKLVDQHPTKRLIIHDWSEHADRAVHQKLHRWGRNFADGYAPFDRIKRGAKTEEKEPECTKGDFEHSVCTQNEPPRTRAWPEPVSSIQSQCPEPAAAPRATHARPPLQTSPPPLPPDDVSGHPEFEAYRSALASFMAPGTDPPDDAIVSQVIFAARGAPVEALVSRFRQFAKTRHEPPKSYGFWPPVIGEWFPKSTKPKQRGTTP